LSRHRGGEMVGDRIFKFVQASERFFEFSSPENLTLSHTQQLHGNTQSAIEILNVTREYRFYSEFAPGF
jgi:hypothetical protein